MCLLQSWSPFLSDVSIILFPPCIFYAITYQMCVSLIMLKVHSGQINFNFTLMVLNKHEDVSELWFIFCWNTISWFTFEPQILISDFYICFSLTIKQGTAACSSIMFNQIVRNMKNREFINLPSFQPPPTIFHWAEFQNGSFPQTACILFPSIKVSNTV